MCDQNRCCPVNTVPALVSLDYEHSGEVVQIGDFNAYIFGPSGDSKKDLPVIVVAYDIFGVKSNILQMSERLAVGVGAVVVLIDFFRGEPFPTTMPLDHVKLMSWIEKAGSWDVVREDVEAALSFLREERQYSLERLGSLGFCWGGKQAIRLGADARFTACAMAHPSFLTLEDAQVLQCPIAVLPSKDEPEMADLHQEILSKPFASKCLWQRFDDMPHGWCGARGDWTDPLVAKQAQIALALFVQHFSNAFATSS